MEKTIAILKRHHYGNIIFLAVTILLISLRIAPLFSTGQSIGVTLERYAIMITIIVIPVTLKYFSHQLKKMAKPLEKSVAIKMYKRAFYLRLYSLSAVTTMLILLFAISRNMNFFWFILVMMIVFQFCSPSHDELENLTENPEEERIPETDGPIPSQDDMDTLKVQNIEEEKKIQKPPHEKEKMHIAE